MWTAYCCWTADVLGGMRRRGPYARPRSVRGIRAQGPRRSPFDWLEAGARRGGASADRRTDLGACEGGAGVAAGKSLARRIPSGSLARCSRGSQRSRSRCSWSRRDYRRLTAAGSNEARWCPIRCGGKPSRRRLRRVRDAKIWRRLGISWDQERSEVAARRGDGPWRRRLTGTARRFAPVARLRS
jgi:hypothetical protein